MALWKETAPRSYRPILSPIVTEEANAAGKGQRANREGPGRSGKGRHRSPTLEVSLIPQPNTWSKQKDREGNTSGNVDITGAEGEGFEPPRAINMPAPQLGLLRQLLLKPAYALGYTLVKSEANRRSGDDRRYPQKTPAPALVLERQLHLSTNCHRRSKFREYSLSAIRCIR